MPRKAKVGPKQEDLQRSLGKQSTKLSAQEVAETSIAFLKSVGWKKLPSIRVYNDFVTDRLHASYTHSRLHDATAKYRIGERTMHILRANQWSTSKLAEHFGVSQSAINHRKLIGERFTLPADKPSDTYNQDCIIAMFANGGTPIKNDKKREKTQKDSIRESFGVRKQNNKRTLAKRFEDFAKAKVVVGANRSELLALIASTFGVKVSEPSTKPTATIRKTRKKAKEHRPDVSEAA